MRNQVISKSIHNKVVDENRRLRAALAAARKMSAQRSHLSRATVKHLVAVAKGKDHFFGTLQAAADYGGVTLEFIQSAATRNALSTILVDGQPGTFRSSIDALLDKGGADLMAAAAKGKRNPYS